MGTGQAVLEEHDTTGVDPAPPGAVVVAVDTAEDASAAVRWAATVAATLGAGLELVHVHPFPPFQPGPQPQGWTAARLQTQVAHVAPDVPVRYRILEGDRRVLLPHVAARAALLVVGAHAHERGPRSWPAHPSCALAVVAAGGVTSGGPVRAVLDGSPTDRDVLQLTADLLRTRPVGSPDVELVRVWDPAGCCDRGLDASLALDDHITWLRRQDLRARPGVRLLGPRDRTAQLTTALHGATEVVVGPRAPLADWFAVLQGSAATLLVTATGDLP